MACERELWHKKHEVCVIARDKDRDHFVARMAMLRGYIGILNGELVGHGICVPLEPTFLDLDPPAQRQVLDFIPVPPGLAAGWGFDSIPDWVQG